MNDCTITPELRRADAQSRLRSAKDSFTRIAVDVLHNRPGCEERVRLALAELAAARCEIAALDAEEPA